MKIKIKYHDADIKRIEQVSGSDWCDLRAAETIHLKKGQYTLIPLGVSMQLPEGYEAYVIPRSSTFKRYHIIQANSIGLIDESYCGNDDQWYYPVYAIESTTINKNDRICQFRVQRKMDAIDFVEVEDLCNEQRGGFGSTGVN